MGAHRRRERWREGWRETRCVVGGKEGGEGRGEIKQRLEYAHFLLLLIYIVLMHV